MTVNFAPGDLVRARGREWVALPSPQDGILALRPLSGSENDTVILDPELEILPVEPARFDLPADACRNRSGEGRAARGCDASDAAARRRSLPVSRATRLRTARLPARAVADGASPASAAPAHRRRCRHRQDHRGRPDPARADGSRRGRCVLGALPAASRRAMGGRAEGALRDRRCRGHVGHGEPAGARPAARQTLFDAYPFTVVSLDYIKAEKRRESFARACPDFVIVDEAHACVGTHKGGSSASSCCQGWPGIRSGG